MSEINQLRANHQNLSNDMIEYWSAPFRQEYLKDMLKSNTYNQELLDANTPVYPWSLVAGKPKDQTIPVSTIKQIIQDIEATRISCSDTYTLEFALHNLKRHINLEQQ